ncbi:hypothetical protein HHK36_006475 [Tetracentron sinense]|uniref:Ribosomal protein L34Ae n=1 Tax=Tetracentron sinense TaxID=13715 RepID=A0A834ZRW0_TETSI|nr:hypothetical protein HHK36_006475 [Tetracentron sinense]
MDFFKVKKFRKAHKPNLEKDSEDKPVPPLEELKNEDGDDLTNSAKADQATEIDDDEDDDFIMNEVKKRLKELRRNSFLVLIPEEDSCPEEEEGETSWSESRDSEVEGYQPWCGFDTVYEKYCERMLFFDRMRAQQPHEAGSQNHSNPSPRSASKKLASTLRCFSSKKLEEPEYEGEHLQQQDDEVYQDLETAYVAQICLTWEALHCQYTQMREKISSQNENPTCYSHAAQQFQQFQVLLQRFIENEPFEQGLRVEIYTRTRNSFPNLLQVPNIQGSDSKGEEKDESDFPVLASDLIRVIEGSILTFCLFLKMDKKTSSGVLKLFGRPNQISSPLQQIQSFLEKGTVRGRESFPSSSLHKLSMEINISFNQ